MSKHIMRPTDPHWKPYSLVEALWVVVVVLFIVVVLAAH